jgi:hypothetical protein
MNYQESLKRVSDQAFRLYLAKTDDRLFFHNLAHTARFLEAINKIHSHYLLDDKNYFIVCTAAWLHNLEIISPKSGSEESKTSEITCAFLKSLDIGSEEIIEIRDCILATKMPQQPTSLNEKIVCDAYLFYFGSENFTEFNKLMRREIEALTSHKINGNTWRARTISMLENHVFHTEYCQSLLNKTKEDNLQAFIRIQEEKHWQRHLDNQSHKQKKTIHELLGSLYIPFAEYETSHVPFSQSDNPTGEPVTRISHPSKTKHHLRGVETMFRNSSSNHQRLSVMADNKAFIMISVNSILISVAIGLIIGKFVLIPKLFIPTVILLTVNVITIIYSVLATRPGVMKGTFTRKEVEDKTVDLLFFGSFYKMPLEDFSYGMRQMMDDSEFLYSTLIKDIYLQGKILGRKFRLLRISYNLFMYGTVFTVIAYIISFFF